MTLEKKSLRAIYNELGQSKKNELFERFERETGKSLRTFYNRIDTPEVEDYLLFSTVLGIPISELMGREPFPPADPVLVEDAATALATKLGLVKPPGS